MLRFGTEFLRLDAAPPRVPQAVLVSCLYVQSYELRMPELGT